MSKYASILTEQALTIYVSGRARVMHRDHKSFAKVLEAYKAKDFDKAISIMDMSETINHYGQGKVSVSGGIVYFEGKPLHNAIADKIITMQSEGFDVSPMINFLENLMDNPSHRAVKELYLFLEHAQLPITEDGHFLAYKRVRSTFYDIHSNTIDNSPGQVVKMLRNTVDDNRNNTCSDGLHFCSINYLPNFSSYDQDSDKVVIVKINPRDVVSIPADYNNTKGRCCEYLVLEQYTGPINDNVFKKSVWLNTDKLDHVHNEALANFENEGGCCCHEHHEEIEESILDGGKLSGDELGRAKTLDLGTLFVPRKVIKVAKKETKPVYGHLIGELREDEKGIRYTIDNTERERGPKGIFTGRVLVHFTMVNGALAGVDGVAPYEEVVKHKVVEHVLHPGANMLPDYPEAVAGKSMPTQLHVASHISSAELARQTLEEDYKNNNNTEEEIDSESYDEESFD